MEDDKVVLLNFWPSPFGLRVRISLAEKGVAYENEEQNLADKSALLIKMNPVHKKIPVLIHKGKPICESLNIVQYIDEVWKNNPLLPQDPYERAIARFWADFVDNKVYDCGSRIWKNKGEAREAAKKEFIQNYKLLEGALGDKPYFGGESFGYVDVALFPFAWWFHTTSGNSEVEEHCPKIIAWLKRCTERESVSKALPDPHDVDEFLIVLKKRFGIE